jgi:hypothetical protein
MEEHSPEELKKQTDEKQHAEHEQAKKINANASGC